MTACDSCDSLTLVMLSPALYLVLLEVLAALEPLGLVETLVAGVMLGAWGALAGLGVAEGLRLDLVIVDVEGGLL